MRTTTTPTSRCPACGYVIDRASSVEGDATPTPGDFSVCMDCGAVLRFDAALRVRLASGDEVAALPIKLRNMLTRLRISVVFGARS